MLSIQHVVKGTLILSGFAIIAAFAVNAISPTGIALMGQWNTEQGVITAGGRADVVNSGIEINDVEAAWKIFDDGSAVFVDARAREEFENGHIPGAISFPIGSFDTDIISFMENYPTTLPLVIYCSGRECDDSHHLAGLLTEMGYSDVRVFIDGFPAWQSGRYPIEP